MSNNPTPTPPRIEREAHQYVKTLHYADRLGNEAPAYIAGAEAEFNRAAPVVKALEEWQALDFRIHTAADAARIHLKAKQILETYKADQ